MPDIIWDPLKNIKYEISSSRVWGKIEPEKVD